MEKKLKTRVGRVLSNKMNKTVIVSVKIIKHHPLYGKTINATVKYKVHDGKQECRPGDTVRIIECRPLSAQKHWRVTEIISREEVLEVPVTAEPQIKVEQHDSELQPT